MRRPRKLRLAETAVFQLRQRAEARQATAGEVAAVLDMESYEIRQRGKFRQPTVADRLNRQVKNAERGDAGNGRADFPESPWSPFVPGGRRGSRRRE